MHIVLFFHHSTRVHQTPKAQGNMTQDYSKNTWNNEKVTRMDTQTSNWPPKRILFKRYDKTSKMLETQIKMRFKLGKCLLYTIMFKNK